MANPKEGTLTSKIGEFCCVSSYTQFQVCILRRHVETVRSKLDSLEDEGGKQGIYKITKFLRFVGKTLSSIEQEIGEKKKKLVAHPAPKSKERHPTGHQKI